MSTDTTQETDNQASQDYINAMWDNYYACQDDINAMDADATDINNLENQELGLEKKNGKPKNKKDGDEIDQMNDQIAADQADYDSHEADLEARDPEMDNLCEASDSFLASEEDVQNQDVKKKDKQSDLNTLSGDEDQVFVAMNYQLQSDMYGQAIEGDTDGQLTDQQLEMCSANSIQAASSEQSVLNNLITDMNNQIDDYNTQEDQAKVNKTNRSYYTGWMLGGTGEFLVHKQKKSQQKTINNDNFMITSLLSAMVGINNAQATTSPEFMEVQFLLDAVMKDAAKIISDDSLSPTQKQDQLLVLMMFALGLFNVVKSESETEQSDNQQKMAEANLDASQMNLDKTKSDEEIQANMERHQKIMGIAMKVAEGLMIAAMTIAAPGAGTAAVILLMGVLSETGVLSKATNALGNAIGCQWAADLIVGVISALLTGGVGAGLDVLAETAGEMMASELAETAAEAADAEIEAIAEKAAEDTAGKTGDEAAAKAVKEAVTERLQKVAKSAAEDASKKMVDEFMSQRIGSMVEMITKKTFKEMLVESVTRAASDAAVAAVENIEGLIEVDAVQIVTIGTQAEVEAVVEDAANNAVAKVAKKDVEEVAKKAAKSTAQEFAERAAVVAVGNELSLNLLGDIVAGILKKEGAEINKQWVKSLLESLEVIEQLLALVTMMGVSGSASAVMESSSSEWTKAANGVRTVAMGANSAASIQMFQTGMKKAKAMADLQITASLSQLLETMSQQIQKDGQIESQRYLADLRSGLQQMQSLASHLHDGDTKAIRMLAQAV